MYKKDITLNTTGLEGVIILLLKMVVYFSWVYYTTKIGCIVVGMYYKSIILLIPLIVNNLFRLSYLT
jgi:hypothetical protein